MKKKSILALMLAASMAAASLSACGGGSSSSSDSGSATTAASEGSSGSGAASQEAAPEGESVSRETDIVAGVNVDFTTMDPADTSDTLSGGIQRMITDGLFGFDDDMNIIPMLATDYEANDEATEFILHLREGVSFTNGEAWNADACKANLDRMDDENLGLKRSTFISSIIDTVEKVDDYTVKVTLTEPFGAFIANLAHPCMVCLAPETIAAGNDAAAYEPIGCGQYKFVEWVEGEKLTLELNEDWWGFDPDICGDSYGGKALADSDAGFKSITFKPVPEAATRVAMIQSGEANVIWPIPAENYAALEADSSVKSEQCEGIVVRYLFMNNQKEPFKDVRVRQAINLAIDREAYCAVVWSGLAVPATSIIGANVAHYKANEPVKADIEKAKQLLADAGYPDGFKTKLTFTNTTMNTKQAEFLQQQLAQIGIQVELDGAESAITNQKVEGSTSSGADAEVELYMIGWSPSTGDADWGIRPLLAIENEPPASYNICYYENEEADKLIHDGIKTADEDEREEIYAKLQDLIWEDVPLVCLAADKQTWATTEGITNVKVFSDGAINFRNAKYYK